MKRLLIALAGLAVVLTCTAGRVIVVPGPMVVPSGGGITYVGVAACENTPATVSPVVNYPTVQENDIMLAFFAASTTNSSWGNALPSGWTLLHSGNDGSSDSSGAICWKRAGASEPANETWTDFLTSTEIMVTAVVAYRGCVTTGSPIDVSTSASTNSTTAAKTCGPITTTGANRMIVAGLACDPDNTGLSWASGNTRIGVGTTPDGVIATQAQIDVVDYIAASAGETSIVGTYDAVDAAFHMILALTPAP